MYLLLGSAWIFAFVWAVIIGSIVATLWDPAPWRKLPVVKVKQLPESNEIVKCPFCDQDISSDCVEDCCGVW